MSAAQGSTGNVIAAICSLIIPGLGQLFTGRLNAKEKRELVIFLTPRIVR